MTRVPYFLPVWRRLVQDMEQHGSEQACADDAGMPLEVSVLSSVITFVKSTRLLYSCVM